MPASRSKCSRRRRTGRSRWRRRLRALSTTASAFAIFRWHGRSGTGARSGLGAALERALPAADLVHVHGLWNMTGSAAVARARAAGRPVRPVAARHAAAGGDAAASRAEIGRVLGHANARICAARRSCTRRRSSSSSRSRSYGPPVVTIANGVTPVVVSAGALDGSGERARIDADDEVVLCLGRLHPIKRLDLLAAGVCDRAPRAARARVWSSLDRTKAAIAQRVEPLFAPVAAATRWLGAVDAETAGALFAASRTLVQCSDSESFGMSVAEALAAGLPVVVTNETPWPQVAALELGYSVAHEPAAIAEASSRSSSTRLTDARWARVEEPGPARHSGGKRSDDRCATPTSTCSTGRGVARRERGRASFRAADAEPARRGRRVVAVARDRPRAAQAGSRAQPSRCPTAIPDGAEDVEMHGAGGGRATFLAAAAAVSLRCSAETEIVCSHLHLAPAAALLAWRGGTRDDRALRHRGVGAAAHSGSVGARACDARRDLAAHGRAVQGAPILRSLRRTSRCAIRACPTTRPGRPRPPSPAPTARPR